MLKKKVGTAVRVPIKEKKPVLQDVSKLTPIQKAQLARAANKKSGTTAKTPGSNKRPALPTFQAPADFKPHFVEVTVRTEADGLLGTDIRCIRYVGRYDPTVEDKKKRDMSAYDMKTIVGIQARLAGLCFKPNNEKKYPAVIKGRTEVKGSMRLPANTVFVIVIRANRKRTDGTLSTPIRIVQQKVKNKETGRVKVIDLDKKDPVARMIKRASRFLPAAFKNVQQPPALRRKKLADEEE